jgi:pilus assembly protein FimV
VLQKASEAAAVMPTNLPPAPSKPQVALAVPPAAPGLVDSLIENPLVPAGAILLTALLAFYGFYRSRQRKGNSGVDSVFLESSLRPDSFFGASGGQSVDTNDNAATGSSMVYSPSQLDAVDNVDPVAEADVYLAYGRDLQAEEILKDALRTNPARIAIHQKLLEIFAKRLDTKSFERVASLAFKVTGGAGPDWQRICELGLNIDSANALYLPGGQPNNPDGSPSRPAPLEYSGNAAEAAGQTDLPQTAGSVDLDLDLDFSLDEHPASTITDTIASGVQPVTAAVELDIDLSDDGIQPADDEPVTGAGALEFSMPDLDITQRGGQGEIAPDAAAFKAQAATSFGATKAAPLHSITPPAAPVSNFGMMEFDLGSLSLDLGDAPDPKVTAASDTQEDPVATKLALAQEFSAIGDIEGARTLLEEVVSQASGEMKTKAQQALSLLG